MLKMFPKTADDEDEASDLQANGEAEEAGDADTEETDIFRTVICYDENGDELPEEETTEVLLSNDGGIEDDPHYWEDMEDEEKAEEVKRKQPSTRQKSLTGRAVLSAAERRKRVSAAVRDEALRRLEGAARTVEDFQQVTGWYDRMEQSRMRKERRYELLRGDTPIEYGFDWEGEIFPLHNSSAMNKQLLRGEFLDYLCNCLFEMHDLSERDHIRRIIQQLKLPHKEIVFFLYLRLYPVKLLAHLNDQSERNIRKVRATVHKKMQKKLYRALLALHESGDELTHQELDFLKTYNPNTNEVAENDESV